MVALVGGIMFLLSVVELFLFNLYFLLNLQQQNLQGFLGLEIFAPLTVVGSAILFLIIYGGNYTKRKSGIYQIISIGLVIFGFAWLFYYLRTEILAIFIDDFFVGAGMILVLYGCARSLIWKSERKKEFRQLSG